MICYKDRTYCVRTCQNRECYRNLSDEDKQRADERNLPIALADFYEPGCGYVGEEVKA